MKNKKLSQNEILGILNNKKMNEIVKVSQPLIGEMVEGKVINIIKWVNDICSDFDNCIFEIKK